MMKLIHAGLNMLAFVLAAVSLVAVFDFHNAQNIPNMYSLHSWVGLAAIILYSLQVVLGVSVYLLPVSPVYLRAALMPIHVYSGLFIFGCVIATALMGITEKLLFALKDPKYKDSPPEAMFVNILGVLIAVFGGLILWIATRPSWRRPSEEHLRRAQSSEPQLTGTKPAAALSERPDLEASNDARRRGAKTEESGGAV
ncbi:cytochrome b reductase 1 isoform X2 [Electrophorus electricus]|nr:cytochrome b reductase 1 isoform X2 [Electrophorus electricus]